ncbi:MAG: hypothetical protein WD069_14630 [Planctomycetales bacterium]
MYKVPHRPNLDEATSSIEKALASQWHPSGQPAQPLDQQPANPPASEAALDDDILDPPRPPAAMDQLLLDDERRRPDDHFVAFFAAHGDPQVFDPPPGHPLDQLPPPLDRQARDPGGRKLVEDIQQSAPRIVRLDGTQHNRPAGSRRYDECLRRCHGHGENPPRRSNRILMPTNGTVPNGTKLSGISL